jgi:hypothetical protein
MAKQGHMQSIRAENAPTRHRPRSRVHASLSRLCRASLYHGRASKSGHALGVRQPRTHLHGPPRPVSRRAMRRARARRGAIGPPAAHERQSRTYPRIEVSGRLSLEARCLRARISYKTAPPSLPACKNRRPPIRHRRRRHELALPQAPTADQPILALL